MTVGRNARCPCGSGKKHKHCCLGKMDPKARRRLLVIVVAATVAVATVAVLVGWQSGTGNAVLTGVVGLIGVGIYLAIRNPPRSRGRQGGDRIDFGK